MEGFLHYEFGGLIHGGVYFLNFMVIIIIVECIKEHYVSFCRVVTHFQIIIKVFFPIQLY